MCGGRVEGEDRRRRKEKWGREGMRRDGRKKREKRGEEKMAGGCGKDPLFPPPTSI